MFSAVTWAGGIIKDCWSQTWKVPQEHLLGAGLRDSNSRVSFFLDLGVGVPLFAEKCLGDTAGQRVTLRWSCHRWDMVELPGSSRTLDVTVMALTVQRRGSCFNM